MEKSRPQLTLLPRRRFLKMVGAGSGMMAAAGLGVAVVQHYAARSEGGVNDVPVQNPAFRETSQEGSGHLILHCETPDGDGLAYELNSLAAAIWHGCVTHAEFTEGKRTTVAELCTRGLGNTDDVTEFVSVLISKGLAFYDDGETQVYVEYEERYS